MSTPTPSPSSASGPRRRSLILGAAAAVALIALVVVAIVVFGDREDDVRADGDAAATPTATSSAPTATPSAPAVTAEPATPTPASGEFPPELLAVPLDGRAEAGNGVVAVLPAIEAIRGTGTGPGNIAGPSLRVTVRLDNGTAEPMALGPVSVNVYYGAERTPASPLDDPSSAPFQGTLAPGKSATGVYVVRIPENARGDVTVEVGYQAGAPLLIFNGSAD
jgi:hypothetical protein